MLTGRHLLHLLNNTPAVDDPAKDGVLLIQVGRRPETNKELAAVGVGPSVGHRQQSLVGVRVPNLLIIELFAVD